jgi:AcrR family transcriptional regulator
MPARGATADGRSRAKRPATTSAVTRREAKQRTRQRLLSAARRLILAGGESRLAASIVAQRAGVGGATFYEHFQNRDDLLQALSDELFDELRDKLAKARREALAAPSDEEKLRQEFRTPLEVLAANPDLFRLALRVRHHSGSPLGDSSRRLTGNTRRDLVAELVARGYPAATLAERRRLEMVADIHIAATEVLALGYVSGRYPDIDEVVNMLVLVTRGTRLTRAWPVTSHAAQTAAVQSGNRGRG